MTKLPHFLETAIYKDNIHENINSFIQLNSYFIIKNIKKKTGMIAITKEYTKTKISSNHIFPNFRSSTIKHNSSKWKIQK